MSFFPDMGCESSVVCGPHVRAVGWLHPDYPYTMGAVPAEFLTRLKEFISRSNDVEEALYFGAAGGFHTCEFCGRAHGTANIGVPSGELLFVAPEMVVHYIERHDYSPPPEFVVAVFQSPLPDSEEYQLITEPFWHLHQAMVEQMMNAAESPGRQAIANADTAPAAESGKDDSAV